MPKSMRQLRQTLKDTQAELKLKVGEIAHHEQMHLQNSRTIENLKQDPPGAYLEALKRVVPFKYWDNLSLLGLLHQLERSQASDRSLFIKTDGQPGYAPPSLPLPLLQALLSEVTRRNIRLGRFGDQA